MKQMACRQCGGVDLRPVDPNSYVCSYCGATLILEEKKTSAARTGNRKIPYRLPVFLGVLFAVCALIVLVLANRGPGTGSAREDRARQLDRFGGDAVEKEKKLGAEMVNLTPLPDVIGNIYFVGYLKNTGEAPILPRAEIWLLDRAGKKLAVAQGYAARSYLLPGESTPISILATKPPSYDSLKVNLNPEPPFMTRPRPLIKFRHMKLNAPKTRYDSYRLKGEAVNADKTGAEYVQVTAVLLDGRDRIIACANRFLEQKALSPGESSPFEVDFILVKGAPAGFLVDYSAQEK